MIEIQESSKIAVEILNDLLNYEKLSTGVLQLEKSLHYPVPFLLKVVTPLQIQASEKNIQFNVFVEVLQAHQEAQLRGYQACLDKAKMGQVIRNFVSNALKFTPIGGTVDIRAVLIERSGNNWLRFECQDSGHGIAHENQSKIFNEVVHFNANAHQGGGGSGLGLWISKKIVELHGGTVGLNSEGLGHGCLFYFELPLKHAEVADAALYSSIGSAKVKLQRSRSQESLSLSVQQMGSKTRNLLVVDDSGINRKMMIKVSDVV